MRQAYIRNVGWMNLEPLTNGYAYNGEIVVNLYCDVLDTKVQRIEIIDV